MAVADATGVTGDSATSAGTGAIVSRSRAACSPLVSATRTENPMMATSAAATGPSRRECTDASHSALPDRMNVSAVSSAILGQPGTRLISCSNPNNQPAATRTPTPMATNAANCAKNRFGSALSGLPMTEQTTPTGAVPQTRLESVLDRAFA